MRRGLATAGTGLWIAAVLVVFGGCGRLFYAGDDPSGQDAAIAEPFRKLLRFQSAVPTDLDNYVVPVLIAADADLAQRAAGDAVYFTAVDGTVLDYEIESFAPDGSLVAWLRLPTLPGNSYVEAYLRYGQSAPVSASPWDTYAGVWHFNAGSDGNFADSARTNPGRAQDGTRPQPVAGITGEGVTFNGAGDIISMGDPANGSLDVVTYSCHLSVWVRVDSPVAGPVVTKGGTYVSVPGYAVTLAASGQFVGSFADGLSIPAVGIGSPDDYSGRWSLVVLVIDRYSSNGWMFLNGVFVDIPQYVLFGLSGDQPLQVGGGTFIGAIDELRLSLGFPHRDRMTMDYLAVTEPGFMTVGAEELAGQ